MVIYLFKRLGEVDRISGFIGLTWPDRRRVWVGMILAPYVFAEAEDSTSASKKWDSTRAIE